MRDKNPEFRQYRTEDFRPVKLRGNFTVAKVNTEKGAGIKRKPALTVICAAPAPDALIRLLPASGPVDIPEPSLQGPLAQKDGSAGNESTFTWIDIVPLPCFAFTGLEA